ncbi:MAG: TatD family hydrolase [Gammaproteobacteria bacterium]|jgi:TatD DNase family protein|nr:TatD family hydrolase [Gammaproteobacteria bacterium]MBT3488112.1 TatD family hydrolase [Gammaproteobacteria bacterium]MBT3717867.1 TatD family hydrolase [Gammaproteobacteria bacterium]MBT3845371.1 TatD family hydrolase [Gammaproteobacteria bacterium]MBT3894423.1 TatD family hydrolase [Gammaproteobacteria bacterium]
MIDSHCHLDRLKLEEGETLADALLRAKEVGVFGFLNVCIDLENYQQVIEIAQQYPQIWASVGVHPNEMEQAEPTLEKLLSRAENPKVVAIGETGLDYHYITDETLLQQQRDRFRIHIEASQQCGKPLIIHTRAAPQDTIEIMRESNAANCGGVMHCFTENREMARQALDLGFFISFSGIITFNSAKELREVVKLVPADRLLIETDSPYLAPVPYRGKPNQPAYVTKVAEKVAELRNWTVDDVIAQTTHNFEQLFLQDRA